MSFASISHQKKKDAASHVQQTSLSAAFFLFENDINANV